MNIALIGYGKMGHEIETLAIRQGHKIATTIDNTTEWKQRSGLLPQCDIAIDFSQPDQAVSNINRCFDIHLPIVEGTTGWYDHLDEIKKRCLNEKQSLFYAPNFSIGMNIMFILNKHLAKFAKKYHYNLSLAETHHIHKIDKPSGTAIKLANDIMSVNSNYDNWALVETHMPHNTLPITAIREGEVFGIHSVTAISETDNITLTHEAHSRKGLAEGALAAATFLFGKIGCYTMEDLLKE